MRRWKYVAAPTELWNPGAVEQWLEHEAQKGWRLYDCGNRLARLERVEPRRTRVRLQPIREENARETQDRHAFYEEMGWRYAADIQNYEVYDCTSPAAPELETDPVVQQWAWERSLKRSRRDGWMTIVLILICAGILVWVLRGTETPVRAFIQNGWMVYLSALLLIPDMVNTARQARSVRQFRKNMKAGLPMEHTGDWKRMRREANVTLVSLTVLAVIMVTMNIIQPLVRDRDVPMDANLPYIAAEELDARLEAEQRSWSNAVRTRMILMPESCQVWESYPQQMRVDTTYEKLLLAPLAEPLYEEMRSSFLKDWPEAEQITLAHPDIDEAVLLRDGETVQQLMLRRDKVVFTVWTNFPMELENHLDRFAALLESFS